MCDGHQCGLLLVECPCGYYYSADGGLYGYDESFGAAGDGGWYELHGSSGIQLGGGFRSYHWGIVSAERGDRDAIRVCVVERRGRTEPQYYGSVFAGDLYGEFYDAIQLDDLGDSIRRGDGESFGDDLV